MALIETENLTKVFFRGTEEIKALNNLTLSINAGEFVAITGSSGSGKSTLMYILGLLDRQTSGRYSFNGRLTDSMSDNERAKLRNLELGFIFQSFHLLPKASALRNVMMPLIYGANYGRKLTQKEMEELATEALRTVGLQDRLNHRPNELSGGQSQRVAIARALVNSPRIIFADEPTGNLDSKRGKEILDLFSSLHHKGVTIVLVTHDTAIAAASHRQIIMRDGSVIAEEVR